MAQNQKHIYILLFCSTFATNTTTVVSTTQKNPHYIQQLTFATKFSSSKILLDLMSLWHRGGLQQKCRYSCTHDVNIIEHKLTKNYLIFSQNLKPNQTFLNKGIIEIYQSICHIYCNFNSIPPTQCSTWSCRKPNGTYTRHQCKLIHISDQLAKETQVAAIYSF